MMLEAEEGSLFAQGFSRGVLVVREDEAACRSAKRCSSLQSPARLLAMVSTLALIR
jgi:hypothetical protein